MNFDLTLKSTSCSHHLLLASLGTSFRRLPQSASYLPARVVGPPDIDEDIFISLENIPSDGAPLVKNDATLLSQV